jgi:mediator of RNA polymerase II transcription subunit 12
MGPPSDATSSMAELRRSLLSRDVEAAKRMGESMYQRHGPYPGWATIWWATIVDCLKGLSLASTDTAGVLEAISAHVDQVTGFAGFTIDQVVGEWLETVQNRFELFSAVSPLRQLFLILVTRRRLSTLTLLDKHIYVLWKSFSSILLSSRPNLTPAQLQAIDTTVILAQQLLLCRPPNPAIPPIGAQEAFIAYTSRSQVLSNTNMPNLIRHLPYLVVLGSLSSGQRTKDQISLFFRDLAFIPEFKTAAFRHLALLKDAFLSTSWGKAPPEVEGGMIDTLKAIMSEGPPSKVSSMPSLDNGSEGRLSAWRWTSVVLEMRVEFKRLAIRINEVGVRETLKKLVEESINREHSADGVELLCETFKGIDSVAIGEIVSVGLDRLGTLLEKRMEGNEDEGAEVDLGVEMVLRILCSVGMEQPMADHGVLSARYRLLERIGRMLQSVGEQMGTEDKHKGELVLETTMKALKYVLGLKVDTTGITAPRPDFVRLVVALLRISIVSTPDRLC